MIILLFRAACQLFSSISECENIGLGWVGSLCGYLTPKERQLAGKYSE